MTKPNDFNDFNDFEDPPIGFQILFSFSTFRGPCKCAVRFDMCLGLGFGLRGEKLELCNIQTNSRKKKVKFYSQLRGKK